MANTQKGSCVLVINRTDTPFLRHIVNTSLPYDKENFESWYYGCGYQKLPGDEFIFCSGKEEYEEHYRQLKEEENRLYGQTN